MFAKCHRLHLKQSTRWYGFAMMFFRITEGYCFHCPDIAAKSGQKEVCDLTPAAIAIEVYSLSPSSLCNIHFFTLRQGNVSSRFVSCLQIILTSLTLHFSGTRTNSQFSEAKGRFIMYSKSPYSTCTVLWYFLFCFFSKSMLFFYL